MQQGKPRRSNRQRADATRADLLAAARKLFTAKTYAETSTPDVVAAAGMTRGALYHHFADKQALFEAVVEQEAQAVAMEIERASSASDDSLAMLIDGGRAYLEAMRVPGRTRLLLIDGPAVIGRSAMNTIDRRHGSRTLREGLAAAMRAGAIAKLPLDALASQLGAMFDRAALSVEDGSHADEEMVVLAAVMKGLWH